MPVVFQRLPGFRDFPPQEHALRSHIQDAWRRVARRYGFQEYDAPPLEPLELYVEKSGAEIVDQLYNFTDKGGREVALRPEMTPSLARMLVDRSRSLPKPIRWFSAPQLFRYERQQRGRLREHFQWNVDVLGEEGVLADAEVLAVAIDGLRELGLTSADFRARVSDRRLLAALLGAVGVPEEKTATAFAVVDKVEREGREKSMKRLETEVGLAPAAAEQVLALFANPTLAAAEPYRGNPGVDDAIARLESYLAALDAMGLGDFAEVDLTIVRGLAYYTGIVFELFDTKRTLRAICGGGRYDKLLERVGGESLPAVGFGMGDVVLGELLAERGLIPAYAPSVDYFIVTVDAAQRHLALEVAHRLREQGHSVQYALKEQAVRKQLSAAGVAGAKKTIILGPDEVAAGVAVVRDMASGGESKVAIEGIGERP
jgi:histidyl-tRNA synthetase